MKSFDAACRVLGKPIQYVLQKVHNGFKSKTMEIVLRAGQALYLVCHDGIFFVDIFGECKTENTNNAYIVNGDEVHEAVLKACGFAVYAHRDELRNGFISLGNGSRMAITGMLGAISDVPAELSAVYAVRIRIGRHIKTETNFIFSENKLCSVLLAGPPASGKTTLLRNITENLSDGTYGRFYRVAVVDERNEIFPEGLIQAPCADVLSGIRKDIGINNALRLCAPQVIICDEIGSSAESKSILDSMNSGVKFICSIHADSREELFRKMCFVSLFENNVFERIVFLSADTDPCKIESILDRDGF